MESECVYVSYSDIIILLMTHSSRIVKRSSMAVNENVMQSLFFGDLLYLSPSTVATATTTPETAATNEERECQDATN